VYKILVGKHEVKEARGAAYGNYRKRGFEGTGLKSEDGREFSGLHDLGNSLRIRTTTSF
jgi:hypothetical protein